MLKARYYMRGMYYGRPAGCLMLDVACTMSKESLDHHAPLWYAIVSVTDQVCLDLRLPALSAASPARPAVVRQRGHSSPSVDSISRGSHQLVPSLCPSSLNRTPATAHRAVRLLLQFVHQRMSIDAYNAIVLELAGHVTGLPQMEVPPTVMLEDGLVVKNFDNRRIVYQESEFRFMLMRHWSLYESMMHSPYVSSALRTWTARLLTLSCKMHVDVRSGLRLRPEKSRPRRALAVCGSFIASSRPRPCAPCRTKAALRSRGCWPRWGSRWTPARTSTRT